MPPGDVTALARALAEVRADVAWRERIRTAAREAAVTRHSWRGVVEQSLALVRQPVGQDGLMGSADSLAKAWPGLRRTVTRFRPHIMAERKLLILGTLAMFAGGRDAAARAVALGLRAGRDRARPAAGPRAGRWPASTASAAWW